MATISLRILIIGTGSLLNYGCEAIVQGSYRILKRTFPNCEITVASDDIEYDRQILPDDVKLIPYKRRLTFYRIFKGLLRRIFHIGNGSPVRMNTSIGGKYDIVLSAGGDNYCERPDYGIYTILEDLMKIGEVAFRKRRKYILWGASVGPFHDPMTEKRVVNNLALTSKILVREDLSFNYLSQFGNLRERLHLVADPAFQMKPLEYIGLAKGGDKKYVGINMSALAVGHIYKNSEREELTKVEFARILDRILMRDSSVELLLIPHVNQNGAQNDLNYLRPVYDCCEHKERIRVIEEGLGARMTKGLIAQLDLLVAARMHCCVAGISSGTPTLFVTYSNKGKGMSGYAYGHHDYEIECNQIFDNPDAFIDLFEYMLGRQQEIRKHLELQMAAFDKDSMQAGEILRDAVEP